MDILPQPSDATAQGTLCLDFLSDSEALGTGRKEIPLRWSRFERTQHGKFIGTSSSSSSPRLFLLSHNSEWEE